MYFLLVAHKPSCSFHEGNTEFVKVAVVASGGSGFLIATSSSSAIILSDFFACGNGKESNGFDITVVGSTDPNNIMGVDVTVGTVFNSVDVLPNLGLTSECPVYADPTCVDVSYIPAPPPP